MLYVQSSGNPISLRWEQRFLAVQKTMLIHDGKREKCRGPEQPWLGTCFAIVTLQKNSAKIPREGFADGLCLKVREKTMPTTNHKKKNPPTKIEKQTRPSLEEPSSETN